MILSHGQEFHFHAEERVKLVKQWRRLTLQISGILDPLRADSLLQNLKHNGNSPTIVKEGETFTIQAYLDQKEG